MEPGVVAFKAVPVYSTGMNGKDIVVRPGPGAGASVALPAGVGVPGVILTSLAPYLGRRAYRGVSSGRLLLHSRGWVGASVFQAPGFVKSRGSAAGSGREGWLIAAGVSWVLLGITPGVNYPWIAGESTPGFGGRRRFGILAGVFQGWGCTSAGCNLRPERYRHWRLQRAGLVNAQASTWRRVCALGMLEAFCRELLPVSP